MPQGITRGWTTCPVRRGWGSWAWVSPEKRWFGWIYQQPHSTYKEVTEWTKTCSSQHCMTEDTIHSAKTADRKNFLPQWLSNMGAGCLKRLRNCCPWRFSRFSWNKSPEWPGLNPLPNSFEQNISLDNLLKSLPPWTIQVTPANGHTSLSLLPPPAPKRACRLFRQNRQLLMTCEYQVSTGCTTLGNYQKEIISDP